LSFLVRAVLFVVAAAVALVAATVVGSVAGSDGGVCGGVGMSNVRGKRGCEGRDRIVVVGCRMVGRMEVESRGAV
jgi:hypothetical protein